MVRRLQLSKLMRRKDRS